MSSGVGGGAPSVVGQAGMPTPAPRPRGPKLKFTPEDDALLIDLKENKSLTWKQIADFFPGRSSGTLQVRYCTKLKAKTTQWTDETVRLPLRKSCSFSFDQDWLGTDARTNRTRNFARHFKTTKTKNGATSQTKSGPGLRLKHAENGSLSYPESCQKTWEQKRAYSNPSPHQVLQLLRLGTPSFLSIGGGSTSLDLETLSI